MAKYLLRYGEKALWTILLTLVALNGLQLWIQFGLGVWRGTLTGDFCSYYVAARVQQQDPGALYDPVAFGAEGRALGLQPLPYLYPPILAWTLRPLSQWPLPQAFALWTGSNLVLLLILLVAALRLLRRDMPKVRWLLLGSLLAPPLLHSLSLGQVDLLLLVFLLPAMLQVTTSGAGRQVLRGIGIALAAHLKPSWGLLVLFELVRKRFWSAAAAGLLSLLLWGVEIAALGPAIVPDYLRGLRIGSHVNGLLWAGLDGSVWGATAAFFGLPGPAGSEAWVWPLDAVHEPILGSSAVLYLVLALLAGLGLVGLSWRPVPEDGLWDRWTLQALVVVMMVTPLSAIHSVVLLFPAFLFLVQRWPSLRMGQRLALWWVVLALLFSSLWYWGHAYLWPLGLMALPLLAGRMALWGLLRTAPRASPAAP